MQTENPKMLSFSSAAILGLLISLGLIMGGYLLGWNLYKARMNNRFVTVKGLAERNVKADLAIWTLSFGVMGDDITKVSEEASRKQKQIIDFITTHGFKKDDIVPQEFKVIDRQARNDGSSNTQVKVERYQIRSSVKVRSADVDKVQEVSQLSDTLIKQGIVLGTEYDTGVPNPIYLFTQLNSIRPAMLAEATRSARQVAQQFAADSGSNLGNIHRANQGVFEITSRDSSGLTKGGNDWQAANDELGTINKKVRIVSTLEFFLTK